jgi:dTMP kinase
MKGIFITFEGIEACGKSTQSNLLVKRLKMEGYRVRLLREPGGTAIGKEVRHTLLHSIRNFSMANETELLLMNASRAQLVREVIRPSLAAGEIVVCDRFYDSTTAYQGYGRRLDLAVVRAITEFAIAGIHPNITILLNVSLGVSASRRARRDKSGKRQPDRLEKSGRSFFKRVLTGFKAVAGTHKARFRVIDGELPMNVISHKIWEIVIEVIRRSQSKAQRRHQTVQPIVGSFRLGRKRPA